MKRDIIYLVLFIVLVWFFLWIGHELLSPPKPHISVFLPIKDGIIAVVYGTFPPDDVDIMIGSSRCLSAVLDTVYGDQKPSTDMVYLVVHDGVVKGVIPYRTSETVLDTIVRRTEDTYLYYRPDRKLFDYLPVKISRDLTRTVLSCIDKYTHEGSHDDTYNDN